MHAALSESGADAMVKEVCSHRAHVQGEALFAETLRGVIKRAKGDGSALRPDICEIKRARMIKSEDSQSLLFFLIYLLQQSLQKLLKNVWTF